MTLNCGSVYYVKKGVRQVLKKPNGETDIEKNGKMSKKTVHIHTRCFVHEIDHMSNLISSTLYEDNLLLSIKQMTLYQLQTRFHM